MTTTTSSPEDLLRQDIERNREQLGDAPEALAPKVNLPARIKDKVQDTVQAKSDEVKQHVHEGTEILQAKASEVAMQAKRLTNRALPKLPPPVAARIDPLIATVRQRPLPTAAVVVGVLLVLRRLLRRNR